MSEIVLKPVIAKIHQPIFGMDSGMIGLIGGRAGMKTQSVTKLVISKMLVNLDLRIVVVRDQAVQLKNSILYQIKDKFAEVNEKSGNQYSNYYQIQDRAIKRIGVDSPYDCLFTFGMKGSSNDLKARAKGLEGIDILVFEEMQDIRDYDQVRTLLDTVSRNSPLIIFMCNTPDLGHWFIQRFYDLKPTKHDGYFAIEPKRDDFLSIFSTFEDNEFLIPQIAKEYSKYGDPKHPDYDLHYYLTDILGLVSSGRKGRIFPDIQSCTVKEFEDFEGEEVYGIDFGFTNDATAVVHNKINYDLKKIYSRQILYSTGLLTSDIDRQLTELGISKDSIIIADSADPKTINEMQTVYGWRNLRPAVKGANSVETQLAFMKNFEMFDCETSKMLWWENLNFIYAVDINEVSLNIPDKKRLPHPENPEIKIKPDNLQDARRYAVYTYLYDRIEKTEMQTVKITPKNISPSYIASAPSNSYY